MRQRSVRELQALEDAAWASPELRALYATRYVPGFPWHTVKESQPSASSSLSPPLVRRHVVPYDFPFTVFVKGRWVGRRLLDVYAEELPHHTPAYYEACLRSGRLYCLQREALGRHNTQRKLLKRSSAPATGKPSPSNAAAKAPLEASYAEGVMGSVSCTSATAEAAAPRHTAALADAANVVLQHGDVVYHTVHRHEVPVTVGISGMDPVDITAVRITQYGLICVNKPTGLPTHATGRYMYNSLTALLEYVLAPKRLRAWLVQEDALLQSLVSTAGLSAAEKEELFAYYSSSDAAENSNGGEGKEARYLTEEEEEERSEVDAAKLPRPCHRLDKVTSGVLLLAVQRDAAKRIGTVLMRKAKEVDEAVSAELTTTTSTMQRDAVTQATSMDADVSGSAATTATTTPALPSSFQRILSRTYELQKYYLARVVGTLQKESVASNTPAQASPAGRTRWWLPGSEGCLVHHNDAVRSLLESSAGIRSAVQFDGGVSDAERDLMGMFPGGVLSTASIAAHSHGPVSRSTTTTTDALPGNDSCYAPLSAATLCQCLGQTSVTTAPRVDNEHDDTATPTPTELLVLCTPYTGRLHQIRYHLSSLGCPIVGDVVYTAAAQRTDQHDAESDKPPLLPLANTQDTYARNERDYIYFDAALLPESYRRYCAAASSDDAFGACGEAATAAIGVKRDRSGGEGRCTAPDTPSSVSSAWQAEPRCYECAGRLPIVAAKECATSTSAIYLHAWAYEVKESLLVPQEGSSDSCERSCTNTKTHAAEKAGGVREIGGGFVRFEAPPPAWACVASRGGSECVL